MSTIAESNEKIAAAQRRMVARKVKISADVLMLKNSWGAMLTQPMVVGGAMLGGLLLGRRSHPAPAPVECTCRPQGPSLLRSVATALLVPVIKQWIDSAPRRAADNDVSMGGQADSAVAAETPTGT